MSELQRALRLILPEDRIKSDLIDRISYASDAGFYQLIPQAIVLPANEAELKQIFSVSHQLKIPVVFRAGGTSLSGQCITDGILVDLSQHWRKVQVSAASSSVTVQPGVTGGMVNHFLKKHSRKIGPDPASIHAAQMGGILSNNASGMCCGVTYNSYHTLQSLRFILPDGTSYDSGMQEEYKRFEKEQPVLFETLAKLRSRILANDALHQRIRMKYRTKNTVGYSLNAFVDFGHPLDIFTHLLVGAEGTLAFIAEAVMLTLPDKPYKAAAMLYFPGIYEACSAIVPLKEAGAEALELMDRASLRSVEQVPGLPAFFTSLPDGAAALLCEFQTETTEALTQLLQKAQGVLQALPLLQDASFTTVEKERMFYWKLRKGMFPSVGAVRQRGTTVILEDVAFPVDRLGDAILDLQQLFVQYGYQDAIIFGHAKDGNIHFVVTQLLDTDAEISRYDAFMQEVVSLVVHKYDGALKAEHGTGRNMAPFIETEWGAEAYTIMQELKAAADPMNLLNPGVIINASKTAHLENLKDLPQVESEVDKCIECGFCEPSCPSRDLTMTPRRRIVARRAVQRLEKQGRYDLKLELLKQYQYDGLDTCATDGLCATDCPVNINTGELVKRLRKEQHGKASKWLAESLAKHYGVVESLMRTVLFVVSKIDGVGGWHLVERMTKGLRKIIPGFPVWIKGVGAARRLPVAQCTQPAVVYFSSCINRVMEHEPKQAKSLPQTFLDLCRKADIEVLIPGDIAGHCCGQPFSSKGFYEAGRPLLEKTIDALLLWSRQGNIPVVCDFTSCTYTFLQNARHLDEEYQSRFQKLKILDSVAFIDNEVMPNIKVAKQKGKVVLHPTCAVTKLGLNDSLQSIARQCSEDVITPAYAGCCGMAGDRGFLFPELTQAASRQELAEASLHADADYYASATTCEMSLTANSGKSYQHIAYLVDKVTE